MKQNTIVALCVLLLVAVGVAVVGTQAIAGQEPTPEREHDDEVPSNVTISTSPAVQTSTTQPNTYTVVATDPGAVNISQLESFGEVSTHSGRLLEVHLSPNATQDVAALPWVEEVRLAAAPVPTQTNSGENASSLGVAQLHEAGVTGEGARVGVIDAGFDTGAPGVGSNTVDTRQFTTPSGSDTVRPSRRSSPRPRRTHHCISRRPERRPTSRLHSSILATTMSMSSSWLLDFRRSMTMANTSSRSR